VTARRRCCEASEAAGEPIAATASYARNWLVVEVPGTWPRDVSDEAALPTAAREAVQAWLGRTPASRVLFARQPGRTRARRHLVFVVRADDEAAGVRRFELSELDQLAVLDLDAAGEPTSGSLVLVCGHGTRDQCCALRGTAVYGALASAVGVDELWISSHQGGHRFAANVVVLPQGVQLGRVSVEAAARVVGEALDGRVPSSGYRGRTTYPPEAQAAEIAVRAASGLHRIADLRLTGMEGRRVSFRDSDGHEHVAVVEHAPGPAVPASCGADPEAHAVLTARVL
jgi:hypothetical protein